jgi:hypothetical protein
VLRTYLPGEADQICPANDERHVVPPLRPVLRVAGTEPYDAPDIKEGRTRIKELTRIKDHEKQD